MSVHARAMIEPAPDHPDDQAMQAVATFRVGRAVEATAWARATPSGLVRIGVVVTSVLLSAATLIWVARRRR